MSAESAALSPCAYPDALWDAVHDDYLDTLNVTRVCRRHGIGRTAFYARARQEGWPLPGHRTPTPEPDAAPLDLKTPLPPRAVAIDKAWRRAIQALDAGCSTEAMRWMRIHATLSRGQDDLQTLHDPGQTPATNTPNTEKAAPPAPVGLPTPTFSENANLDARNPGALDPSAPGLSRTQRRRLQKYATRRNSAPAQGPA